eukprot:gb/GEZN01005778.1/.p1 GENE.gb/GEZN01005778.1/~~gb/GEZN01005778.1/.p1  ORF type:complete len:425 (+),score=90.56 gb/GEZN01005778.1/:142-1416(+)
MRRGSQDRSRSPRACKRRRSSSHSPADRARKGGGRDSRSRSPPRRRGRRSSTPPHRRASRSRSGERRDDSPDYGDYRGPPKARNPPRRTDEPRMKTKPGSDSYLQERRKLRDQAVVDVWASASRSRSRSKSPERKKNAPQETEGTATKDPQTDKLPRRSASLDKNGDSKESSCGGREDSDKDSDSQQSKKKKGKKLKKKRGKKQKKKQRKKSKKKRGKKKKKKSKDSSSSESSSGESSSSDSSSDEGGDGSDSDVAGPTQPNREEEPEKKEEAKPETEVVAVEDGDMWEKQKQVGLGGDDSEEEVVGPRPPPKESALDERSYGGALMPGEGSAIASFVQKGMRIPRRGEVGLTSAEISNFEVEGFVMSGSRHQRMNAIRIRKENQVYSAEEKRALSLLNMEEKENREKKLMSDFRKYLQEKGQQ